MICQPSEREDQDPAPEHPVTPTKPTRSAGASAASHACPNAEVPETESDREEDLGAKKIRSQKDQAATPCFEIRGHQALGHWREGPDG